MAREWSGWCRLAFVGHGLKLLVCVTTNEAVTSLHPALRRPGRCMAEVEFEPLIATEATGLVGRRMTSSMTLADALADKGDLAAVAAPLEHITASGTYL